MLSDGWFIGFTNVSHRLRLGRLRQWRWQAPSLGGVDRSEGGVADLRADHPNNLDEGYRAQGAAERTLNGSETSSLDLPIDYMSGSRISSGWRPGRRCRPVWRPNPAGALSSSVSGLRPTATSTIRDTSWFGTAMPSSRPPRAGGRTELSLGVGSPARRGPHPIRGGRERRETGGARSVRTVSTAWGGRPN